jgi:Zn-dependent protease with chaperone function
MIPIRARWTLAVVVSAIPFLSACASSGALGTAGTKEEKLDSYAEFREGDVLIVDGQRVRLATGADFKGRGEARDFASIPLGYEVKARGIRLADGTLLADELEAKPNGNALFENQVRSLTDEAEQSYRRAGNCFQEGSDGNRKTIGKLYERGPQVARVRRIMNRLLPPYIDPDSVRVYVIENDEWNAFAMGNYSIYVYSGLLRDLDDDELAIVIGHELVHASHEHTRRQFKKAMWVQLAALGVSLLAEDIDNKTAREVVQLLALFSAMTWHNGFGRTLEDQADRVGLRYAYEGGFDVTRGPRLWNRFANKYGEPGKVANFFFGDHSLARKRAVNLERELALNYPEGPRAAQRQPRPRIRELRPEQPNRGARASSAAAAPAQALSSAPVMNSAQVDIRPGMSMKQVRALLGSPLRSERIGAYNYWKYPDFDVVFEGSLVKDVEF